MNVIAVDRPPYHNNLPRITSDIDDLLKTIPNLETTVFGGNININLLLPDNSERAFVEVMFSSILTSTSQVLQEQQKTVQPLLIIPCQID